VAAIQKRGEPVSYDDLARFVPAVAPENNAAEKLMALFPQITPLHQFKPTPAKSSTGTLPPRGRLPEDYRRWYLQAVAGNSNVLQAVPEIAALQHSQFPINWRQFNNPTFFQSSREWWHTLQVSELINIQTLLSIDDGNQNQAADLIELRFHLARLLGQESIVAPYYSRLTIVGGGLEGLERLVNAGLLSPAIIRRLQNVLQAAETDLLDTEALRRALICERAVLIETAHESDAGFAARAANSPGGGPGNSLAAYEVMKFAGRWEAQMVDALRMVSAEIEMFNLPLGRWRLRVAELDVERGMLDGRRSLALLSISRGASIGDLALRQLSDIARVRAAQTALAIELRRVTTNRPTAAPEKLDELVPQFLAQIPTDPFDGKPIRYARQKTGYVVYSIGRDGIDNHGRINPKRQRSEEPAFMVNR
jgi:hypothetical protein